MQDVLHDALEVGEALGLQQQAAAAVAALQQRMDAAKQLVATLPPVQHPKVSWGSCGVAWYVVVNTYSCTPDGRQPLRRRCPFCSMRLPGCCDHVAEQDTTHVFVYCLCFTSGGPPGVV
jgi:hypothetical protein